MLITIGLIMLSLFLADKALSYYGVVLGLLHYMYVNHGYQLDTGKLKELRDAALARRVRELFIRD